MNCPLLIIVLLTAQLCSSEDVTLFKERGGEVTLTPDGSHTITSVLWKWGNDKVAEYDPDFEVETFGKFKGRADLDQKSGIIKISPLTDKDSGVYSVEINHVLQPKRFSLEVKSPVTIPKITVNDTKEGCVLVCKAENSLEHQWTGGQEGIIASETNTLLVRQEDLYMSYTCTAKNQAGSRSSTVKAEDVCGNNGLSTSAKVGIGTGVSGVGILIAAALYYILVYKEGKQNKNPKRDEENGREDKPSTNSVL